MLARWRGWLAFSSLASLSLFIYYRPHVQSALRAQLDSGAHICEHQHHAASDADTISTGTPISDQGELVSNKTWLTEAPGSHTYTDQDALLDHLIAPKIRQVTMLYSNGDNEAHKELDERCIRSYTEYGKQWGFPTHILRNDVVGHGEWLELLFSKPLYLLSLMVAEMAKPRDQRTQWLVFFDSDTILLNPHVPWDAFLPPEDRFSDINVVATKDWNGFNAGVFFLRVTEWTLKMLSQVVGYKMLRPEVELGPNVEQSCFRHVFTHDGFREPVVYFPVRFFNTFEQSWGKMPPPQPGEILIHFSGMKGDKYKSMGKYFEILEQKPESLQIPFEETFYPTEIEAFWRRLNEARVIAQRAKTVLSDNSSMITSEGLQNLKTLHTSLQRIIETKADLQEDIIGATSQVTQALKAIEVEMPPKAEAALLRVS